MTDVHEMAARGRLESGEEEWCCTACARRTLIRWKPGFRLLVLDEGDTTVTHTGSTGPVALGTVSATPPPAAADHDWLRSTGITWDDDPGRGTPSAGT